MAREVSINHRIKILRKEFLENRKANPQLPEEWEEFYQDQNYIKMKMVKLFNENSSFSEMNKDSILTLLVINSSLRVIPFHQFALSIDIID